MKNPLNAANCLLPLLFCLLLSGCAGPNPTQARVSFLCLYAPRVTVYAAAAPATNGVPAEASAARSEGDSNALTARASQRGGVAVIFDNQLAFPVGSGEAASNSVLSGIEIPLVKEGRP